MLHSKHSREKSPNEAVKAAIEYTISQDFAAGHTAEQARRLRGFHGDDTSNLVQLPQSTSGKQQLQDYQMQLMLLEQQNKKRLIIARQELGSIEETEGAEEPEQDNQVALIHLEQQNKKRLLMTRKKPEETMPLHGQEETMSRHEQEESEESEEFEESEDLAQSRAEHLEPSRKRRKLDATADDKDENPTSTSATMGQVTSGLDQASNYDVRSLDKISLPETDVCRRSLAISEFSIRSIARAITEAHTIR